MKKLLLISIILFIILIIISIICFKKLISFDINKIVDKYLNHVTVLPGVNTIIKKELNINTNADGNNNLMEYVINEEYKNIFIQDTTFNNLIEPVLYYKNLKGKNIRTLLTNQLGIFFGIDKKIIDFVSETNDTLHNASLVIDDIQDNSITRRENPCAHIKYGIPYSIGSSYLQLFKYLYDMTQLNNIIKNIDYSLFKKKEKYSKMDIDTIKIVKNNELLEVTIENLYKAHIGQELDVYWSYKRYIPTLEEYQQMVEYKTGILFKNILDYFYLSSTHISDELYDEYNELLLKLGLFFQIRDDYINVTDIKYWKTKGFCEDFDEKKNSYIIICYMNNLNIDDVEKKSFYELFYKKDLTYEEKVILLSKLNNTTIFDDVYNELLAYKNEICQNVCFNVLFDILPFNKFDMEASLVEWEEL